MNHLRINIPLIKHIDITMEDLQPHLNLIMPGIIRSVDGAIKNAIDGKNPGAISDLNVNRSYIREDDPVYLRTNSGRIKIEKFPLVYVE